MNRNELVATAKELGIAKAHQMKSVDLEVLIEQMKNQIEQVEVKKLGRKVNPESVRQIRLMELEAKRAAGELRRGRPVVADSERQKRITELAAKRASGELHRGRPVDTTSERQKRIAGLEAKRAAGELRRGRPKKQADDEISLIGMLQQKDNGTIIS
jgi:hypothetical protein